MISGKDLLKTAGFLGKLKVSPMLHSYGGMPINLLIMDYPVNPNSSVPQVVFQLFQQTSESALSLDRQGGKHPVSEENCGFSFCYPPTWSVML